MENAVMVLETAIKDVEAKLDTIAWKLESYEKGALSYIKKNDSRKNVSVIELMQNIQDIKNDFAMLRLEVIDMEERNKEIKNSVTAELDSTLNEFSKLKAKLKDR